MICLQLNRLVFSRNIAWAIGAVRFAILIGLFLRLSFAAGLSPLHALQVEPDQASEEIEQVAQWFDKQVVLSFHVCDFQATWKSLRQQPLFDNDRFLQLTELLWQVDPNYKLACDEFLESLHDIQSLHFFWVNQNGNRKFVVCLKMKNAAAFDSEFVLAARKISGIDNQVGSRKLSPRLKNQREGEARIERFVLLLRDHQVCYYRCRDNWFFVSNSLEQLKRLDDRMEAPDSFRSLIKDRPFQTFLKTVQGYARQRFDKVPSIRLFARPSKLPNWFGSEYPNLDNLKRDAEAAKLEELVAAGALIELRNEEPFVVVDGFVSHTLPTSGLAKIWDMGKSVQEIPPIRFDILFLEAEAWDPRAYLLAKKDNPWLSSFQSSYWRWIEGDVSLGEKPVRRPEHIVNSHSGRYYFRYQNKFGLSSVFALERVVDYEAARATVEDRIARTQGTNYPLNLIDDFPGQKKGMLIYAAPEKVQEKNVAEVKVILYENSRSEFLRAYGPSMEKYGLTVDQICKYVSTGSATILTKDWIVTAGNAEEGLQQLEFMNGGQRNVVNRGSLVPGRIQWLEEHGSGFDMAPCRVQVTDFLYGPIAMRLFNRFGQAHLFYRTDEKRVKKLDAFHAGEELDPDSIKDRAFDWHYSVFAQSLLSCMGPQVEIWAKEKNQPLRYRAALFAKQEGSGK